MLIDFVETFCVMDDESFPVGRVTNCGPLYRSYGGIEGRHTAERPEKWRKDSILSDDSPPYHMSPSPQLYLMKNLSALLFWRSILQSSCVW